MTEIIKEEEVKLPVIKPFKQPEVKQPTIQEQITKLENEITEINGYIDFIDMIKTKEKGDTFVLRDIYCVVEKVTEKDRHISMNVYKYDNGERGKWLEKRHMTPSGLDMSRQYGNDKIFIIRAEIRKLENKLGDEKFVIVDEMENEKEGE